MSLPASAGLALAKAYPEGGWVVRDDGDGPFLHEWTRPEPCPTQVEIEAMCAALNAPQTLAQAKESARAAIASARYAAETGGLVVSGVAVATDRDSQGLISGAALGAILDPSQTVRWKGADGSWTEFTAAQITALALAVRNHVQACFDREREMSAQIEAAEIASAADVHAWLAVHLLEGWPG